ncbi:ribonuclease HII [Haloarcula salinisoli]|uniref:Ribonuclease HII n=1 Tax=Haloarcula salinisoli TaxID=2487746 RepID=A0A8J7YG02_9EURY|nr:ribonuclease HII [Halomicroarcula salinisoli]MBX0287849.1 ribonuclease HII [Halomicroarcula salinisoli]MBX0304792.1 ribonuclease HII [Halomicroarcula salinisoli]
MRLGVDEAGKGPVLGSMFAAAVRADPDTLPDGVGDSKGIAPAKRERLDSEIRTVADAVAVTEIPVARIDDPETDMNTLTVAAHAEALAGVADDGLAGLVDAGDTDADRFGRRVADRVDATLSLTAEHGADETDPLVGAASILAKVARDSHVEALADIYGDVGSGYPSDPTTREFLSEYVEEHGELPECARASWSTCEDVLAAAQQSSLGEF